MRELFYFRNDCSEYTRAHGHMLTNLRSGILHTHGAWQLHVLNSDHKFFQHCI